MGRNLLRRSTLILLLMTALSLARGYADSVPLTPAQGIRIPLTSDKKAYLPCRQNQSVQKAWSIDFESIVETRPEFTFWLNKWNSPEGRQKIKTSMKRFFDFRSPVDRIIRKSGLPWELSSIPFVESNWRIDAVSPSGAVGPWQFIESSARGRHLVIDTWRDERRDIWRSTEAAMSEMAFYNRIFHDWLLSIASYNAGPTRIQRLCTASGLNTYWELLDAGLLPPENQDYVPQIIVVSYIQSHAGRSGLPIHWKMPIHWVRIPLDQSLHMQNLIDATGMNEDTIMTACQELYHPVTPPPSQPYFLKVPEEHVADTLVWLESLKKKTAYERFWKYTVHSGDTLSEIAHGIGISLSELLGYNNHVRNGILRTGERLYLPGNDIRPGGADEDTLPVWNGRYHVSPGDSFWSIALHYGVRPEKLAEVNHRSLAGILLAGSVLHVPLKEEKW